MMLILAFAGAPIVRAAGIPHMINYQGELTDPNAEPIHDPNLSMTFTFYDAPVDGNSLFSETQNVDVNDGLFGLLIGSASGPNGIPESVFAGQDVYLGIQIGTDTEMTPRQKITSVAYAFRAAQADLAELAQDALLLDGQAASEFAAIAHDHDATYAPISHNHDGVYAPISHNHDAKYYTQSEINSLFYTKSQIDSMFYSKSEIDSLFYSKSEIDNMFYTKAELDPKLLTASQKFELTGGGVTSLHYHPTGQLEAWPSYLIYSTSKSMYAGSWFLFGECAFTKTPGSALFRVISSYLKKDSGQYGIKIETSMGTRTHYPELIDVYADYEDIFDITGVSDLGEIWVKFYISGGSHYAWAKNCKIYTQQNAP